MELLDIKSLPDVDIPIDFQPQKPADPVRLQELAEYVRIAMSLLKMPASEMQQKLSCLPVPERNGWGKPRKVSAGNVSSWLSGSLPMPIFRIAGALALLELKFFEYMVKLRDPKTPDGYMGEYLNLARKHHGSIVAEPILQPYLLAYRISIFKRLKKDYYKSAAHRKLFHEYDNVIPQKMREIMDVAKKSTAQ